MIEWLWLGPPLAAGAWAGAAAALDAYGRQEPPDRRYDAVVVAGCRVFADGTASPALLRRAELAAELFHRGFSDRIVTTGGRHPATPVSEAWAAAEICVGRGVPPAQVSLEEESRTTRENAAFAARLVQGDVLVVSDAAHAFRCRRMFARHFARVDVVGAIGPRGPRVRLALREVFAVVRHGTSGNL
ncbi:MAG: YdcF family protein [Myxococcota bacterium]